MHENINEGLMESAIRTVIENYLEIHTEELQQITHDHAVEMLERIKTLVFNSFDSQKTISEIGRMVLFINPPPYSKN